MDRTVNTYISETYNSRNLLAEFTWLVNAVLANPEDAKKELIEIISEHDDEAHRD